jgi:VanZ family protein
LPSREQISRWLPVVAWAVLISVFSTGAFAYEQTGTVILPLLHLLFPSATPDELRALHATIRKLAHFMEYLVLSVLLYRALRSGRRWDLRAAGMAVVIAGLYSIGDELHQLFVPGRTAAATDCLIDVSGAAAGQGLLAAWGTRGRPTRSARAS